MKNLKFLGLFALLMLFFVSCEKDDNGGIQAPIDIPTTVKDVEIPFASIKGTTLPGPINVELKVDFNQQVKDKTGGILSLNNVKSAKLQSFSIELTDTKFVGDLTAIKDADIYVKAEDPSVAEVKVAEVRNNTNKKEMTFTVADDKNLIDYFKANKTYVVIRNITAGASSLTTFTVTLKPVWKFSFGL